MLKSNILACYLGLAELRIKAVRSITEEELYALNTTGKGSMKEGRSLESRSLDDHVTTGRSPILPADIISP